jgi:predicted ribosome quality control (RQC) complex YloA/Tae2 family protein
MRINSKISYNELEQLTLILKEKLEGSFLKKIYHYDGLWLFKFNHHSFIYEPGNCIWTGSFTEREDGKNLHSICKKLRKEIGDRRLVSLNIFDNDRTLVLEFKDYKLILELYAQGNMILLDNNNKIIKVQREIKKKNSEDSYVREHGMIYELSEFKNFIDTDIKTYGWKVKDNEITENFNDFENIFEALSALWSVKYNKKQIKKEKIKKKKNKFSVKDNVQNQIKKFTKKINNKDIEITDIENSENIDYKKLGKLYSEKKKIKSKLKKAENVSIKKNKKKFQTKEKTSLNTSSWYQKYHWWYTKNGFLVVGGKNADDNEKLVKTYLKKTDYYFHTDEAGSGSFILITENKIPQDVDFDETAEGVLAFSTQWNSSYTSGEVYYVLGNQVTKTPNTGEYIVKGSFIVRGKRNYIKVTGCTLGYGLYNNKLMLAPYRIINRLEGGKVKIKPSNKKTKGKVLSSLIKRKLNVILNDNISLFNKPCNIN